MTDAPEYLPGDNLPLPSTPPQEPSGTFSPAMHTRYPVQRPGCLPSCYGYGPWHTAECLDQRPKVVTLCQPPDDALRGAQGVLYAAVAGALVWLVVICLFSH